MFNTLSDTNMLLNGAAEGLLERGLRDAVVLDAQTLLVGLHLAEEATHPRLAAGNLVYSSISDIALISEPLQTHQ
jgi:hypothetical protein